MIDRYLPSLPYELIGMAVVALVLLIVAVVVLLAAVIAVLVVWTRGWARLSNRMYRGYKTHPEDERPPVWRLRVSGVSLALSRFKFRKIPRAYRKAEDMTENDATLRQYLSTVFLD